MGFKLENYPFMLQTGVIMASQNIKEFSNLMQSAYENKCNFLISNIFPDKQLKTEEQISLDFCYIRSQQDFQKQQIEIVIPMLNQIIWSFQPKRKLSFLKLTLGYIGYLGLSRFSVRATSKNFEVICASILEEEICKLFLQSNLKLVLIINNSDSLWEQYISFQEALAKRQKNIPIQICLQITENSILDDIERWISEKITFFILPFSFFELGEEGSAISLPKEIIEISNFLITLRGVILFKIEFNQTFGDKTALSFTQAKENFQSVMGKLPAAEKESIKLQDILFNPLQPHSTNLELNTYKSFEVDDKKYLKYETALTQAFFKFEKSTKIVIYYIGSGRGRLLENIFRVSTKTQRKVFIYAIEKYPYPIQTLKRRININKWSDQVQVIYSDIRDYQLFEHADIYLSELLGGFGDNQLAPQCVYWAEKNLKKQTIFIPQKIESYIRPISYQHIHRIMNQTERQVYSTVSLGSYYSNFETLKVWQFVHPIRSLNIKIQDQGAVQIQKFSKSCQLQFIAPNDIIVNGFAGYFKSKLFNGVEFSILPEQGHFSKYSWHPIFFPFKESILVRKGQKMKIKIERKRTLFKAWYEWEYRKDEFISEKHNRDGKTIAIYI